MLMAGGTMASASTSEKGSTVAPSRLQRLKQLQRCTLAAAGGDLGRVMDLYFDDESWTARYLVIDTGGWLTGRQVLLPPHAIEHIDVPGRRVVTQLGKQLVQDSPGVGADRSVSRQDERDLYDYYRYPYYWTGPYRWGISPLGVAAGDSPMTAPVGTLERPEATGALMARKRQRSDLHLRSAADVGGQNLDGIDGPLGHVDDFLIEEQSLAIRYLILDPISWWPGKRVLVSTEWIEAVGWNDATVVVTLTKEALRNAPEFDPVEPIDRTYETRYHTSLGKPGYWQRTEEEWRLHPSLARAR
jgi:hypothetical protein